MASGLPHGTRWFTDVLTDGELALMPAFCQHPCSPPLKQNILFQAVTGALTATCGTKPDHRALAVGHDTCSQHRASLSLIMASVAVVFRCLYTGTGLGAPSSGRGSGGVAQTLRTCPEACGPIIRCKRCVARTEAPHKHAPPQSHVRPGLVRRRLAPKNLMYASARQDRLTRPSSAPQPPTPPQRTCFREQLQLWT